MEREREGRREREGIKAVRSEDLTQRVIFYATDTSVLQFKILPIVLFYSSFEGSRFLEG